MTDALLGPAETREIARRLGIRPAKRLGQNFVVDPGTVRRIVALAEVGPRDVVLEVGPGFGSLTLGLIGAGRGTAAHGRRPCPGGGAPAGRGDGGRRPGGPLAR